MDDRDAKRTKFAVFDRKNCGAARECLEVKSYFDFSRWPFDHQALFDECEGDVVASLDHLESYACRWLQDRSEAMQSSPSPQCGGATIVGRCRTHVDPSNNTVFVPSVLVGTSHAADEDPHHSRHYLYVGPGASVVGASFDTSQGSIWVGAGCVIEPFVNVKGPCIIGEGCVIRSGAYLRGNVILGKRCCLRGELKHVVMMDECEFPHPGYVGDSVCGHKAHFGNQASTANYGIFQGLREQPAPLICTLQGVRVNLGRVKMGSIIGDRAQVGCNSVLDPGTFLGPCSVVYGLTRLNSGYYPAHSLIKNKPLEKGVLEVTVTTTDTLS